MFVRVPDAKEQSFHRAYLHNGSWTLLVNWRLSWSTMIRNQNISKATYLHTRDVVEMQWKGSARVQEQRLMIHGPTSY